MRYKKPTAAVLAALCAGTMLAGCGGKSNAPATQEANGDAASHVQINEQPRENLDQGGTLRWTVGSMGGNMNWFSNAGNTSDTSFLMTPLNNTGCFNYAPDGTPSENKDYCEKVEEKIEGDHQVITYKLNEKATWNDGTPIDYKTFVNQWEMLSQTKVKDLDVTNPEPWKAIAKVERGASDKEVVVTTKKIYEPYTDLYDRFLHPAQNTKDLYEKGWQDKIRGEWQAGPFKVERLDLQKRTLTIVPNEKWWGDKPMLDRIVYTEMGSKADVQAYRNRQIDVTLAGNLNRYNQVKDVPDSEFRRGQRTSVFGFILNSRNPNVADKELRKAVFQAINRPGIVDIRYKGLNWKEAKPGSWVLPPYSALYKDSYPEKDSDPAGAAKTLEAAGYTKGADGYYAKAGKVATVPVANWGDDPVGQAIVAALQGQLKEAGIKVTVDQRAESAFNSDMEKVNFAVAFMGYTLGSDGTSAPAQFYKKGASSNLSGCGTEEIDKKIEALPTIVDVKERHAKVAEAESEWMKACYGQLSVFNGPSITAINKYIANYGPAMFKTTDYTKIGWMKGHKKG